MLEGSLSRNELVELYIVEVTYQQEYKLYMSPYSITLTKY